MVTYKNDMEEIKKVLEYGDMANKLSLLMERTYEDWFVMFIIIYY